MIQLSRVSRALLLTWAVVSLAAVALAVGYAAFRLGPGNRDRHDAARAGDVRFVLNWCELGADRLERVVHSFTSARSLTGDHVDAYAIAVTHLAEAELTARAAPSGRGWIRGDEPGPAIQDAVRLVANAARGRGLAWFPAARELLAPTVYVYPWRVVLHGTRPSAAQLIFVRPLDRLVFYSSAQT